MTETKVVTFPGHKRLARQKNDETIAKDIRAAHRRLCKLIDEATKVGLQIDCQLDSTDTYGDDLVRCRDIVITRKV